MRLRHDRAAAARAAASPLTLDAAAAEAQRGSWAALFPAVQPLYLEIGMGRGRFILESAALYPEINYLGLELRAEMIAEALDKIAQPPANLRLLHINAALLGEAFAPGEAARIYLNFPDPWPKSRHAKRRLTAPFFLSLYEQILADQGQLWLKTDDAALFQWSLANLQARNWQLLRISHDLPAERSGVITEYENRYRKRGQPIFAACAAKPEA